MRALGYTRGEGTLSFTMVLWYACSWVDQGCGNIIFHHGAVVCVAVGYTGGVGTLCFTMVLCYACSRVHQDMVRLCHQGAVVCMQNSTPGVWAHYFSPRCCGMHAFVFTRGVGTLCFTMMLWYAYSGVHQGYEHIIFHQSALVCIQ